MEQEPDLTQQRAIKEAIGASDWVGLTRRRRVLLTLLVLAFGLLFVSLIVWAMTGLTDMPTAACMAIGAAASLVFAAVVGAHAIRPEWAASMLVMRTVARDDEMPGGADRHRWLG